jgi:hypothetical protein
MTTTATIDNTKAKKHIVAGKQPVVVQIYDSTTSMYFSTRMQITDTDLMQMREIAGLTRVEAVPTHYWVEIGYGNAFSYQELVPQILLCLADILGVQVSALEVTQELLMRDSIDETPGFVEEAKKLDLERRRAYVVQRINWLEERVSGMRQTIKGHLAERRQLLREQKRKGWS